MNRITKAVAVLIVLAGGAAMMRAQEKEAPKAPAVSSERPVYKLDFVVAELEDGKKVNSRTYSIFVQHLGRAGSVNVSTRVPIATGASPTNSQVQYMDVGLSLEYRVVEEGNFVVLEGNTRIESFATGEPQPNSLNMPITRRIAMNGQAAVTPGKPTVIGSVDDVNSKKRYEVQVTATKIK